MKIRKEATAVHEKLNVDANRGIIKAVEEGHGWQEDLALMLSKPDNMGGNNMMIIRALIKTAAEKYHYLFEYRKDEDMKDK